mgnify:CR=1 FL=1
MIYTNHPINPPSSELCNFVIENIGLSKTALNLGLKKALSENAPLPIILFSYGLINLNQYQKILIWQRSN